jgi:hypothetical protein
LHFSALTENSTSFFSNDSTLFTKKQRGLAVQIGGVQGWANARARMADSVRRACWQRRSEISGSSS